MKIIADYYDPCRCEVKRFEFLAQRQQSGFRDLGVDTVLECECGIQYVLIEAPETGLRFWDVYRSTQEVKGA